MLSKVSVVGLFLIGLSTPAGIVAGILAEYLFGSSMIGVVTIAVAGFLTIVVGVYLFGLSPQGWNLHYIVTPDHNY